MWYGTAVPQCGMGPLYHTVVRDLAVPHCGSGPRCTTLWFRTSLYRTVDLVCRDLGTALWFGTSLYRTVIRDLAVPHCGLGPRCTAQWFGTSLNRTVDLVWQDLAESKARAQSAPGPANPHPTDPRSPTP
eukprot:gene6101-2699_t